MLLSARKEKPQHTRPGRKTLDTVELVVWWVGGIVMMMMVVGVVHYEATTRHAPAIALITTQDVRARVAPEMPSPLPPGASAALAVGASDGGDRVGAAEGASVTGSRAAEVVSHTCTPA